MPKVQANEITINYEQQAASGPFYAALLRVGRLSGDPGPINTWFAHPLSDDARVALHESVSLVKQAPSEVGNAQGNQPIGVLSLAMPPADAHSCYRLEMTPGALIEVRVQPSAPQMRCYQLINLPTQGPTVAALSTSGAEDPEEDLASGGGWPDPTPPPPPNQ